MMSFFKGYKAVLAVYVILSIIGVLWVINYDRPDLEKQVKRNNNQIIYNA